MKYVGQKCYLRGISLINPAILVIRITLPLDEVTNSGLSEKQ